MRFKRAVPKIKKENELRVLNFLERKVHEELMEGTSISDGVLFFKNEIFNEQKRGHRFESISRGKLIIQHTDYKSIIEFDYTSYWKFLLVVPVFCGIAFFNKYIMAFAYLIIGFYLIGHVKNYFRMKSFMNDVISELMLHSILNESKRENEY